MSDAHVRELQDEMKQAFSSINARDEAARGIDRLAAAARNARRIEELEKRVPRIMPTDADI